MNFTRRSIMLSAGGLATASLLPQLASADTHQSSALFPDAKQLFPDLTGAYLDSASIHPMNVRAADAVRSYLTSKEARANARVDSSEVRGKFAALIGADAASIAYAPSTTGAENLIVNALGFPEGGGRIITDALHFVGSFYIYEQLKAQGVEVIVIPMEADGSIDMAKYEDALAQGTDLVALSHVSFVNGFEHDMKAICNLAHQRGARVYADIIQSAGSVPVNVTDWGVDFAASGTYKWLMGDFGHAFLYARPDVIEELRRPWYGYLQTSNFFAPETRLYPLDPTGEPPFHFIQHEGVAGIFSGSFPARAAEVAVAASLEVLAELDVSAIQSARRPIIDYLQDEMRARGFEGLTPVGTRSAIVSFVYRDASQLRDKLAEAGVSITLSGNRVRISPSLFNSKDDIDQLLDVIGKPA